MAELPTLAFAFLAVTLLLRYIVTSKRNKQFLRLPPGPRSWPIVGNIFDAPYVQKPWITYRNWGQKYGSDILYINIPQRPTIVLNSARVAYDLLEKRSRNYSDRPRIILNELTGWDYHFAFMQYGQRWRDLRRVFHQHFYPEAASQYHAVETREVRAFLQRALAFTEGIDMKSTSQTFTSIIFDVVYGLRVYNPEDRYVWLSQKAVEPLFGGTLSGVSWVESFPWLRYLPTWCPGSSARRYAEHYRPLVAAARDEPFTAAKNARASNRQASTPSMVGKVLEKLEDQHLETSSYLYHEEIVRDAAGVAYIAAVDTQKASIHAFFLAMALHPTIQRKAQHELETVVGLHRLPTMGDIPALPYVEAILREVFRWMPSVPAGVFHRSIADDEYNGYTIPAGSIIVPNAWAMLHDPEDYPDPESFNPDRFIRDGSINPDVRDPLIVAFGFGRRICPGRYLAMNTLRLMMASILHVFDILPLEDGSKIDLDVTTSVVSYPVSLACRFNPRNQIALDLINGSSDDAVA